MTKNNVKQVYQPYSKTNTPSPNHQNINHSIVSRNLTNYQLMPASELDSYWSKNLTKQEMRNKAQRIAQQQSQLSRSGMVCDNSGSIPICYNSDPNNDGGRVLPIGAAEQQYLFSRY